MAYYHQLIKKKLLLGITDWFQFCVSEITKIVTRYIFPVFSTSTFYLMYILYWTIFYWIFLFIFPYFSNSIFHWHYFILHRRAVQFDFTVIILFDWIMYWIWKNNFLYWLMFVSYVRNNLIRLNSNDSLFLQYLWFLEIILFISFIRIIH